MKTMRRLCTLKLQSFDGKDTSLHCGDDKEDFLYCVVSIDAKGNAEIVDSAYRSLDEVLEAWPEARADA